MISGSQTALIGAHRFMDEVFGKLDTATGAKGAGYRELNKNIGMRIDRDLQRVAKRVTPIPITKALSAKSKKLIAFFNMNKLEVVSTQKAVGEAKSRVGTQRDVTVRRKLSAEERKTSGNPRKLYETIAAEVKYSGSPYFALAPMYRDANGTMSRRKLPRPLSDVEYSPLNRAKIQAMLSVALEERQRQDNKRAIDKAMVFHVGPKEISAHDVFLHEAPHMLNAQFEWQPRCFEFLKTKLAEREAKHAAAKRAVQVVSAASKRTIRAKPSSTMPQTKAKSPARKSPIRIRVRT
jgi:hypothetical protein